MAAIATAASSTKYILDLQSRIHCFEHIPICSVEVLALLHQMLLLHNQNASITQLVTSGSSVRTVLQSMNGWIKKSTTSRLRQKHCTKLAITTKSVLFLWWSVLAIGCQIPSERDDNLSLMTNHNCHLIVKKIKCDRKKPKWLSAASWKQTYHLWWMFSSSNYPRCYRKTASFHHCRNELFFFFLKCVRHKDLYCACDCGLGRVDGGSPRSECSRTTLLSSVRPEEDRCCVWLALCPAVMWVVSSCHGGSCSVPVCAMPMEPCTWPRALKRQSPGKKACCDAVWLSSSGPTAGLAKNSDILGEEITM